MQRTAANSRQADFRVELLVIFAILVSLGFPGNFATVFGSGLGTAMEYGAFAIEILAMLLSSGRSWLDIRPVKLDRKYWMLYLFVAFIFVESMFVTKDRKDLSISCARLAVTLMFAIWLQERFEFERVLELFAIAQTIFILASFAFMVLYPGMAFENSSTFVHAFRGLYPAKNTNAAELVFGVLVIMLLIRIKFKKLEPYSFWLIVLVGHLLLLALCQATGPVLSMMIALLPLFLPKRVRLPLGWLYIGGSVLFLFVALTIIPRFQWFFDAIGKDATLTGRIPLWNQIVNVMTENKTFTGFGYGMFWRDSRAVALIRRGFHNESSFAQASTGSHNTLLELWLNIGLLGIGVFFIALLYSLRNLREVPENSYIFTSMIMISLLVNGLTERLLSGNYDFRMLTLFLVLALCCNRERAKPEMISGKVTTGGGP